MAACRMTLSWLLFCATVLSSLRASEAVDANELTFVQIRDANNTKQWALSVSIKYDAGNDYIPLNCSNPEVNACIDRYTPLMQNQHDKVRVQYSLKTPRGPGGTLNTWKGAQPTEYMFKVCYTPASSVNRAWRTKNKAYPRLTQNCPHEFGKTKFNPNILENNGTAELDFADLDEVPTATMFVMMWVKCGDTVCAFESTEGRTDVTPPVPGNFFQTEVEMGITTGMRVAAIILSIFGPVFFVSFWIADHLKYTKTGRPITLLKEL